MSGAFLSGSVFQLEQHYAGVTMQQGRVALDADASEGRLLGDVYAAEVRSPGALAFHPEHQYAGVKMQQGTTQLDADASGDATPGSAPGVEVLFPGVMLQEVSANVTATPGVSQSPSPPAADACPPWVPAALRW